MSRPLIFLILSATAALAQDAPAPPMAVPVPEEPAPVQPDFSGPGRVLSSSEQFTITGNDALIRGTIAMLAEETKSELLRLTDEKDNWRVEAGRVPISIILHGKQGDPLPPRTFAQELIYTDAGYSLRLDVHLARGIELERFKYFVTASLLYERAVRGRTTQETETALYVPPWLVEGLREATRWRLKTSDRRLYEGLFKRGGLFKIDDLFNINEAGYEEMDAATRAAFRVSSGAMTMALLEQPQGKDAFRSFLTAVASYDGEMPALLRKHFPELNLSETSLAKWWSLQLANKGAAPLTDIMSIEETEAALVAALRFNLPGPEGSMQEKELTSWADLAPLKAAERAAAVRGAQDALVRLSYRCFPSYRPLILNYQQVINSIIQAKTQTVAAELADLQKNRVTMSAKATRARDYLDWFEITRARETSGAFDDYLSLKERLKSQPRQRGDAISLYLDRLDAIFSRGQQAPPYPATGSLDLPR